MVWTALELTVRADLADVVATFLIDRGAPGVELRDHPDGTGIVAHFAGTAPVEALRTYLAALGLAGTRLDTRPLEDEPWAESWRRHARPQCVGTRLYVCQSWTTAPPPPGRIPVVIDPGMAFGTGDHPTTRACLHMLDALAACGPLGRVLDCGTGSGILGIAAALLGAAAVDAVDTDPDALRVAAENRRLNAVPPDQLRLHAVLDDVPGPHDVVLANLFADALVDLAPALAARLAPGGSLIAAGFLTGDAARVVDAFRARGLVPAERLAEDNWVTVRLRAGAAPSCPPRSS